MINLIDWADYLTVAVFAKAATYLTEAEGDKLRYGGLIVLPPPDDQQKEQLFNSYTAVAESLGWKEKNHG